MIRQPVKIVVLQQLERFFPNPTTFYTPIQISRFRKYALAQSLELIYISSRKMCVFNFITKSCVKKTIRTRNLTLSTKIKKVGKVIYHTFNSTKKKTTYKGARITCATTNLSCRSDLKGLFRLFLFCMHPDAHSRLFRWFLLDTVATLFHKCQPLKSRF